VSFPAASSWDALMLALGNPESRDPAPRLFHYLRRVFPMLNTSGTMLLSLAFERVLKHEMIDLGWESPLEARVTEELHFHSTSALRLPSIREHGLLPSRRGWERSGEPALYTSPLRTLCMRAYCSSDDFPMLGKTFAVMLGVTGTPAGRFKRKNNWQVWYSPGQYVVRCVQFLCIDGPESPEWCAAPRQPVAPRPPEGRKKRIREWSRGVKIIEERQLIKDSWREKLIRRIRLSVKTPPRCTVYGTRAAAAIECSIAKRQRVS